MSPARVGQEQRLAAGEQEDVAIRSGHGRAYHRAWTPPPPPILDFWFGPPDHLNADRRATSGFARTPAFDDEIRAALRRCRRVARGRRLRRMVHDGAAARSPACCCSTSSRATSFATRRARSPATRARSPPRKMPSTRGLDRELEPYERWFLYMPFEHAEDVDAQHRSLALFGALADGDAATTARSSGRTSTPTSSSASAAIRIATRSSAARPRRRKSASCASRDRASRRGTRWNDHPRIVARRRGHRRGRAPGCRCPCRCCWSLGGVAALVRSALVGPPHRSRDLLRAVHSAAPLRRRLAHSEARSSSSVLRPMLLLAFGLVFLTVVAIGYLMHWLIPSLPLAAAFALGAIVSPTDAVATAATTARLPSRRASPTS